MTVSTTNSTQTFSGGQSVLTFTFNALAGFPQYISVNAVALTGGAVTILSYGTQYTVTLSTTSLGGTVIVTPSFGSNYNYIVYRQTAIVQNSSYTNYNSFPAATLMANLDQLTMIEQEFNTNIKLGLSYPIGTSTTYISIVPIPSIGTVLGSDPTGTFYTNVPPAPSGATGSIGPSGSGITLVSSSTTDISVTNTLSSATITAVNAGTSGVNTILRLGANGLISSSLLSTIYNYASSSNSSTLISMSALKIAYGHIPTGGGTNGVVITGLPFSSSTTYTMVVYGSGGNNNNVCWSGITSGTTAVAYQSQASGSGLYSMDWIAIGY